MAKDMDPSFEDYVRGRQRQLVRAAYLMCGSETQAQDLVQEALVKLAARWDSVRTENPDAYVRRILYHDAISAWRRTRRESFTDLVPHRPVSGASVADRVSQRADILAALRTLAPRQRAVVVLRYFEDRTEADTAQVLGVSVGTVKSQAHDGLARLRLTLEQPEPRHESTQESR